jgi:hypothetical protein
MATVDELRLKILDRPQVVINERFGTGDGAAKIFKLGHVPIMDGSVSVYVAGEVQTEGGDYSLDCSTGRLDFTSAPDEGDALTADYEFAAFSDADLQSFIDSAGGNLSLAAGEALTSLIADRGRLVSWSRGDAKIDYDRLRRDLADVARRFYDRGASESGGARTEEINWEEVV